MNLVIKQKETHKQKTNLPLATEKGNERGARVWDQQMQTNIYKKQVNSKVQIMTQGYSVYCNKP